MGIPKIPEWGLESSPMETVLGYVKRRLREVGPGLWPLIAAELSDGRPDDERVSEHMMRKVAYGDRDNPRVGTIQPLLDYFGALDRGEIGLPEPSEIESRQAA